MTDEQFIKIIEKLEEIRHAVVMSALDSVENDVSYIRAAVEKIVDSGTES